MKRGELLSSPLFDSQLVPSNWARKEVQKTPIPLNCEADWFHGSDGSRVGSDTVGLWTCGQSRSLERGADPV
jgi:hypothetical protein